MSAWVGWHVCVPIMTVGANRACRHGDSVVRDKALWAVPFPATQPSVPSAPDHVADTNVRYTRHEVGIPLERSALT